MRSVREEFGRMLGADGELCRSLPTVRTILESPEGRVRQAEGRIKILGAITKSKPTGCGFWTLRPPVLLTLKLSTLNSKPFTGV